MNRRRGTGLPKRSRETKFSGADADREKFIFPVQLTTCMMGNLTRWIHTLLAVCVTIHNVGDKPTVILYTTFIAIVVSHVQRIGRQPGKTTLHSCPFRSSWSAEQGNVYSSVYAIPAFMYQVCIYGQHYFQQSMIWINRVSLPVLLVDI